MNSIQKGQKEKKVHILKVSVPKIGHFWAKCQNFTKIALKKGYRTF